MKAVLVGGNTWIRVISNSASPVAVIKPLITNQKFVDACEKAGVKPTRRQASKWLNKKGSAYKNR